MRWTYDALTIQPTCSLRKQDTHPEGTIEVFYFCSGSQVQGSQHWLHECGLCHGHQGPMEKSGFTVTPDKMPLLPGAPIHASLELTVTLQVSLST